MWPRHVEGVEADAGHLAARACAGRPARAPSPGERALEGGEGRVEIARDANLAPVGLGDVGGVVLHVQERLPPGGAQLLVQFVGGVAGTVSHQEVDAALDGVLAATPRRRDAAGHGVVLEDVGRVAVHAAVAAGGEAGQPGADDDHGLLGHAYLRTMSLRTAAVSPSTVSSNMGKTFPTRPMVSAPQAPSHCDSARGLSHAEWPKWRCRRRSHSRPGLLVGLAPPQHTARVEQLRRRHGRVAHHDQLVVARQLAQRVGGQHRLARVAGRVQVQPVVHAVVEVEHPQVLEVGRAVDGGEQPPADAQVRVHRAAGVHQQQHPHLVAALPAPLDVEQAAVVGRRLDGGVEVELVGRQLVAGREVAQAAQGQLELAHAQGGVGAVALVAALLGHLDRGAAPSLAAHPHAARVHARVPEGRGAAGADPLRAAVVGLGLLAQPLLELAHQLVQVQVAEGGGELGPLLGAQAQRRQRVQQPLPHLVGDLDGRLDAAEGVGEGLVVLVEVGLGLDQHRAAQVVEAGEVAAGEAFGERLHEREPLGDRHGHAVGAQEEEELGEHRGGPGPSAPLALGQRPARPAPARVRSEYRACSTSLSFFSSTPEEGQRAGDVGRVDAAEGERLHPVDQLAGRGLLLQVGQVAQPVEGLERLVEQLLMQLGLVHEHDATHHLGVGEGDVVEDAATQEGVGEFLLGVAR